MPPERCPVGQGGVKNRAGLSEALPRPILSAGRRPGAAPAPRSCVFTPRPGHTVCAVASDINGQLVAASSALPTVLGQMIQSGR
jgi:hypothetical protein